MGKRQKKVRGMRETRNATGHSERRQCPVAVYQVARGGGQEAEATRQLGSIVGPGWDMMEPADIFHI